MEKEEKTKELSEEDYEKLLKIKEIGEKIKENIEKGKKVVEKFKEDILNEYKFISSISIAAPIANKIIEESMDDVERKNFEETKEKELFHVFLIIPDEKIKEIPKLSVNAINLVKDKKPKIWLHFLTPKEIWQFCFDGKYEYVEAIAMSIPVYDTGILGALRVATIHKMMVISKFEKYVVSYVLAGSIVRGQATKTSDVDVFIVIDDTDVKRMSRFELRERLRSIIYSFAIEANERANAKNKLSPQIYILTEFWEAVKEAHPVIFTFIRDGVPLYDRGAFMPWKLLLKMGKIKPSPEAIEMFMSLGERVVENVKKKLNNLITEDIYWGVITPSQAALMLYGIAPPTPKETVKLMEDIFVKKEKILEKRYVDVLKKIVEIYKNYEHEKIKEIKGKDVDFLLEQVSMYISRLKKLAEKLEERSREKVMEDILFRLKTIINDNYGKKSIKEIIQIIKKDFVDKGHIGKAYFESLKKFINIKNSNKKIPKKDFELLRKDLFELIREIHEVIERRRVMTGLKRRIKIRYKKEGKKIEAELVMGKNVYLIPNTLEDKVKKFDEKQGKFIEVRAPEYGNIEEIKEVKIDSKILEELEKEFDEFEIIL